MTLAPVESLFFPIESIFVATDSTIVITHLLAFAIDSMIVDIDSTIVRPRPVQCHQSILDPSLDATRRRAHRPLPDNLL